MRLIKAKEAAQLLDLRLPRLYELVRQHHIPSVRVGEKAIRFDEAALRQWIECGGMNKANSASSETRGVQSIPKAFSSR